MGYEEMAGALTYHDKIKEVDGLPDMVVELNKECGEHREEIEAKIIATKAAERQIANVKQYMERPDLVLERVTSLRFHHAMKDEIELMKSRCDNLEREFSQIHDNIKPGEGNRCAIM